MLRQTTLLIGTALALACALPARLAHAQTTLPQVTITEKALRDPVEKSYRRMVRGMDLFERHHALAPLAELRYKLLPRKHDTDMARLDLYVLGKTVETPVPIGPDQTFTLQRDPNAWDEDAKVTPDRKALTMTWRTDIRTPGLPANVRRLGDLRLECEVGMEAGLVSNDRSALSRIMDGLLDKPGQCARADARYLFFADHPVFGVTLVDGSRREDVPLGRLYAGASDDPNLTRELPYCDCEVLLPRTYFVPLGDRSWPDDTLVEFSFMDAPEPAVTAATPTTIAPHAITAGTSTKTEVAAQLGSAEVIRFDNAYEVWAYRSKAPDGSRTRDMKTEADVAAARSEFVVLFDPSGVAVKTRSRAPVLPRKSG